MKKNIYFNLNVIALHIHKLLATKLIKANNNRHFILKKFKIFPFHITI